jgi:hypothetical protein
MPNFSFRRVSPVHTFLLIGLIGLLAGSVSPPTARGQAVVQVREVTPKQGAASQLEAALRRHANWREEHGDPWSWGTYQVVRGEDHGKYVFRSGLQTWAALDRYDEGFGTKAEQHWQKTVAPMAASTKTYVTKRDTSLTHLPEDLSEYDLYDVHTYRIKPGHHGEFVEAYRKGFEAIMQETDDRYYALLRIDHGANAGDIRVVVPRTGWADFKTPDPSRFEITREVYGEEQAGEIFDQFYDAYRASKSQVAQYRPGLSVQAERSAQAEE